MIRVTLRSRAFVTRFGNSLTSRLWIFENTVLPYNIIDMRIRASIR